MKPALDLDLIRTFLTVLTESGFKPAAAQLNKTPAAISMQIKRLEAQLGQRVLERNNKGIALTHAGALLKEKGERLLQLNYELLGDMREEELSGRLVFGAPTDYAPTLLQKLLPIFSREFPKVTPHIMLEPSRVLRNRIQSGTLDMAIVGREAGTKEGKRLWSEEIAWYGNATNDHGVLKIGLLSVNCILRDHALETLKVRKLPYEIVLEAASVTSLYDGVKSGFCQAFLPTSVVENTQRSTVLGALEPMTLDFALIVGRGFEANDINDLAYRFKKAS